MCKPCAMPVFCPFSAVLGENVFTITVFIRYNLSYTECNRYPRTCVLFPFLVLQHLQRPPRPQHRPPKTAHGTQRHLHTPKRPALPVLWLAWGFQTKRPFMGFPMQGLFFCAQFCGLNRTSPPCYSAPMPTTAPATASTIAFWASSQRP